MPATAPAKQFSWSWSKLKNWRTCPKRHYHVDLAKEFKDESEQLDWGNRVHSSLASRIGKGEPLPREMSGYEPWASSIVSERKPFIEIKVEQKLAINRDFQPVGWFDASTWFRAVIDVAILALGGRFALTVDWKTGNSIKPDFEQLALSAETIFAHYPQVEWVGAAYGWLGHDAVTRKIHQRGHMQEMWNKVLPDVKQMDEAARMLNYPPKPGGLCVHYCPVTSCPFHGKGTR